MTGVDSLPRLCSHPGTGLEFSHAHPDYLTVHYEDFVDGNLAQLGRYLGASLAPEKIVVGNELSRVTRSSGHGDWKLWFTPEDVSYFRYIFQPYLDRYHYPAQWELAACQAIEPALCSHYVLNLINERRRELSVQPFTV